MSSCEEALGAVRTVADPVETPTPAVADADPEPLAVPSGDHQMPATPPADQQVLAGSLIEGESPATPPANQEPPADAATTNEEEAAAAAAAATAPADREAAEGGGDEVQGVEEEPQEEEEEEPQEEPELSESADVEDNEETHDDICRRMKELSVHADRLLGEATGEADSNSTSKKSRSELEALSLSSRRSRRWSGRHRRRWGRRPRRRRQRRRRRRRRRGGRGPRALGRAAAGAQRLDLAQPLLAGRALPGGGARVLRPELPQLVHGARTPHRQQQVRLRQLHAPPRRPERRRLLLGRTVDRFRCSQRIDLFFLFSFFFTLTNVLESRLRTTS